MTKAGLCRTQSASSKISSLPPVFRKPKKPVLKEFVAIIADIDALVCVETAKRLASSQAHGWAITGLKYATMVLRAPHNLSVLPEHVHEDAYLNSVYGVVEPTKRDPKKALKSAIHAAYAVSALEAMNKSDRQLQLPEPQQSPCLYDSKGVCHVQEGQRNAAEKALSSLEHLEWTVDDLQVLAREWGWRFRA